MGPREIIIKHGIINCIAFAAVHPTILNKLFKLGTRIVIMPTVIYNMAEIIISSFFETFIFIFLTLSSMLKSTLIVERDLPTLLLFSGSLLLLISFWFFSLYSASLVLLSSSSKLFPIISKDSSSSLFDTVVISIFLPD